MKFYNTMPEEQETIVNIDYFSKILNIYSSRKSVIQRLYLNKGPFGAAAQTTQNDCEKLSENVTDFILNYALRKLL